MGLLGGIGKFFKKIAPILSFVPGMQWVNLAIKAFNFINDIRKGGLGAALGGALGDLASVGVNTFAGGSVSDLAKHVTDKVQTQLKEMSAEILKQDISKELKDKAIAQVTKYGEHLASEAFQQELTQQILGWSGKQGPTDSISPAEAVSIGDGVVQTFTGEIRRVFTPEELDDRMPDRVDPFRNDLLTAPAPELTPIQGIPPPQLISTAPAIPAQHLPGSTISP
jgi:hypothetical protein